MTSNQKSVRAILADQCRHQVRLQRKRMTWWIPLIFVLGLCVSILGLIPAIALFREEGSKTPLVVFAIFALLFGWAVVLWLIGPLLIRPRIVPYFARELGAYRGKTMAAFARGRGLYLESVALERLAGCLGVKPLSTFGFAYDYYEQEVHWHSAAEGVKTVEALRDHLGEQLPTVPDVADDLAALAQVVRAAAEQGVDFSLVLRLHAKENMQAVCTLEARQGSFW